MDSLSTNDLEALRMLLSYLHNKKEAYKFGLTGRIFKGEFFVSQEEYYQLLEVEAIVMAELHKRKVG